MSNFDDFRQLVGLWMNSDKNPDRAALSLWNYVKPRTITNVEELDALPDGSLIKFPSGLGRTQRNSISALTGGDVITDKRFALPATILYEPTP